MNIIIVSHKHGKSRTIGLPLPARILMLVLMTLVPFVFGVGGYMVAHHLEDPIFDDNSALAWDQDLDSQRQALDDLRVETSEELDALTVRMATMQARLMRLDALGERITELASLDKGEFDFSSEIAVGGPGEYETGQSYKMPSIHAALDALTAKVDSREQQLEVLETLLDTRKVQNEVFVAGRPIKRGWMSSRYGRRTDPFTGRLAWHAGVDFAGKENSDVISVAAGVVTWAADRYGYGLMVEVNHGNGYVTRYAHANKALVKVGDVVKKGQVVALMGSSGRSTGPHVHFEVIKQGRHVNPERFIHRAGR